MLKQLPKVITAAISFGLFLSISISSASDKERNLTMNKPIIDKLENYKKYTNIHPDFEKAFSFLSQTNISQLELTKHVIDGEKVFCPLSKSQGKKREQASLEAHRKYIDIQYVISGNEEMGYRPTLECRTEKEPYNPEKDIVFFKDIPSQWLKVPPGSFIIFFPKDAHAPMVGDGEIHKAVVKIKLVQ